MEGWGHGVLNPGKDVYRSLEPSAQRVTSLGPRGEGWGPLCPASPPGRGAGPGGLPREAGRQAAVAAPPPACAAARPGPAWTRGHLAPLGPEGCPTHAIPASCAANPFRLSCKLGCQWSETCKFRPVGTWMLEAAAGRVAGPGGLVGLVGGCLRLLYRPVLGPTVHGEVGEPECQAGLGH